MLPADNIPRLTGRIYDYLWRSDATPMVRLRDLLAEHFDGVGPAAIVGGLVRDLALKGTAGFRSDIDLVINAPSERVDRLAAGLAATPNRFGGYSAVTAHWKIDFWALSNTWAAAVGLVKVRSFADIVHTTFFDCDAICYETQRPRRMHALEGYLERLRVRRLEINLLPNPSIDGNLLRAARRLLLWGFQPGERLRAFIARELNEESYRRIVSVEGRLYQSPVLDTFGSARRLMKALLDGGEPSRFPAFGEQLGLPGFESE